MHLKKKRSKINALLKKNSCDPSMAPITRKINLYERHLEFSWISILEFSRTFIS